jgi:hypothetical protein
MASYPQLAKGIMRQELVESVSPGCDYTDRLVEPTVPTEGVLAKDTLRK